MKSLYQITRNTNEMDFSVIHSAIAASYWAKGISNETLQKAMQHSMCFGVIHDIDGLVGFARIITDSSTFAYLADVFVLPGHQRKGVAKMLIQHILDTPELQNLRRILLATKDAHGLYQQFGFKLLEQPDMFMEIWDPNIYQTDIYQEKDSEL